MEFDFNNPFGSITRLLTDLLLGLGLDQPLVAFILAVVGAGILAGATLTTAGVFNIWLERKVGARFQDRLGPNRVGPFGLFQGIADAIKLVLKEDITPLGADKVVFNIAPLLAVMSVVGLWAVVPFAPQLIGADLNVGVLYVVAIGGVGTLSVIMAGWSSNNKYALLGALRTVAMLISFEIPMVLVLLVPTMLAGSMGMVAIVDGQDVWYLLMAPVAALVFFISSLAEVGRTPFDLIEAESEIVAGYNIEYSGMKFGMFMVAEFFHSFTIGALFTVLFLGGWRGPGSETFPLLGLVYFIAKTFFMYFVVMWVRYTFPRVRIDQVMALNWKFLTPLALVIVMTTAVFDKLALEQSLPRTPVHLALNVALVLLTILALQAYARALRRKVEGLPEPEAGEVAGAAIGPG
ncbi:MAG TPA: NADH-quinone oxidoreductase subunit NuoH [Anaerolineales bacterium]